MSFTKQFEDICSDMWQYLSECKKPIIIYGMGDGADKIINELEKRNLSVSGIFASDGFVREKVFRGHRVVTYSDIKEKFDDFAVLVSFGTKLDEVIGNIKRISSEHDLFAPDVPVFGDGIFDLNYFESNKKRLSAVYDRLFDDISRKTFVNSVKFRLTGKPEYLFDCETDVSEAYEKLFIPFEGCTYVDVGAYNGDTIREFSSYSGKKIRVFAFEPDIRNFRKLSAYSEDCGISDIRLYNAAAWSENTELSFYSRSGRNSASTAFRDGMKTVNVNALSVDSCVEFADFIKIDAEGSDTQALSGMKKLIEEHTPNLCVAAYHRTDDYFSIPEYVLSLNDGYDLYFRHSKHIPCWDTNFYFIKRGKQICKKRVSQ